MAAFKFISELVRISFAHNSNVSGSRFLRNVVKPIPIYTSSEDRILNKPTVCVFRDTQIDTSYIR
jgi:hypothetical protein